METLLLVSAVTVGVFALLYGSLLVICAPRSTLAVLVRGLNRLGCLTRNVVESCWSAMRAFVNDSWGHTHWLFEADKETQYERDCRELAVTLPAFNEETERIMRREGHLPEPVWGKEQECGGYKAPAQLMQIRTDLRTESPARYMERRHGLYRGQITDKEALATMRKQGTSTKELQTERTAIYAPRIVREVVEVEEIEITSKSSAEVIVEGFERRYYEPIEEPDISRILLDD